MEQVVRDDLTGEAGASPVRISLGDRAVEIDLTPASLETLTKALAPYFEKGRAIATKSGSSGRLSVSTVAVRKWARANGHEVSPKGGIPEDLLTAYKAARGRSR
jgi:hypothetical protein